MPGVQKVGKKLPKRVGSIRLKERRAASWTRSQVRKTTRQKAQNERHAVNQQRATRGEPTPWETSNGWAAGDYARKKAAGRAHRAQIKADMRARRYS